MSNDLITTQTLNHVSTLTLNNPKRLNGWTMSMLDALHQAFDWAAADEDTHAVILTGTDPYYSAGVNLSSTMSPMHPKKLHGMIVRHNQSLFDAFIDFPKPILVAVNGPAIGACVTSATLTDAIIASDKATFSTPFTKLGVPPEGCSSLHLPRLIGAHAADRMLGPEGWAPNAKEALDIGLVDKLVDHEQLMTEAQALAEQWLTDGKTRSYRAGSTQAELKATNAKESIALADAFLSRPFLKGQADFLWSKKKRRLAFVFGTLWATQPAWSRLLR